MEPVQSSLCFLGYRAELLRFEKRESSIQPNEKKPSLSASFMREIEKEDKDNCYALRLGVKIDQPDFPFYAEVILLGRFIVNGKMDAAQAMNVNAAAILYPYVRSTLSMMASLAGLPPITLPTLNIVQMFQNEQEETASN